MRLLHGRPFRFEAARGIVVCPRSTERSAPDPLRAAARLVDPAPASIACPRQPAEHERNRFSSRRLVDRCRVAGSPLPRRHRRSSRRGGVCSWSSAFLGMVASVRIAEPGVLARVIPHRVRLSRAKGWRMPPNTVKVDRSTRWGNPFRTSETFTAQDAVTAFSRWLETDAAGQALAREAKGHLGGKNLACWCALDAPCHADVLLRISKSH